MKRPIAALLLVGLSATATAAPSKALVFSCLSGYARAPSVRVRAIPSHEFAQDDDYRPGYRATFLLSFRGKDLGYADDKNAQDADAALVYLGRLYPLKTAAPLLAPGMGPPSFVPALADWLVVEEGREKYVCVSTNFDGLGRSGAQQNWRAAYLLPFDPPARARWHYAVADIRRYEP